MTVLAVDRDPVALTLTIVSEFDAPAARVWQVWADPRQLERWWGPPTYPATVVDHDLTPGGSVTYYMTGPDGEKYHGWWRVIAVDPPHSLEIEDGFADDSRRPNDDLPTTSIEVRLTAVRLPGDPVGYRLGDPVLPVDVRLWPQEPFGGIGCRPVRRSPAALTAWRRLGRLPPSCRPSS